MRFLQPHLTRLVSSSLHLPAYSLLLSVTVFKENQDKIHYALSPPSFRPYTSVNVALKGFSFYVRDGALLTCIEFGLNKPPYI